MILTELPKANPKGTYVKMSQQFVKRNVPSVLEKVNDVCLYVPAGELEEFPS